MKIIGISILAVFYLIYISKIFIQKKKGIHTDQIGKNKDKTKVYYIELIMKFATYSIILVEILSIALEKSITVSWIEVVGSVIGTLGVIIFGLSVITMKDNWRAGIAENDKTEMVTDGIYKISRNPAFLGFDCVYIGILLMFFNIALLIATAFAMLMLHLQILQEEDYLTKTFGDRYIKYKLSVNRYIGIKLHK